jgi:hypothetical protein
METSKSAGESLEIKKRKRKEPLRSSPFRPWEVLESQT